MLVFLLTALSLAADPPPAGKGELVIDAKMPAEVLVDGVKIGQLFRKSALSVGVASGVRTVRVYTNGVPSELQVMVPVDGSVHVLVGRTGLSVDRAFEIQEQPTVPEGDTIPLNIRVSGDIGVRLRLDKERYALAAGSQSHLALAAGSHRMSVRSDDGTVLWATGTLTMNGPEAVVVQLSEGRMPEVSGKGLFSSGG